MYRLGKSSVLVHGGRENKLEGVIKWTNVGKFWEAGKQREHQEFLAMQTERAKEETITSSEGIVYSWDLTQKDIDEITPDVKTITVDGEEAVERVTGQIREGLWVQLLGTDGTDEVDRTPPSLTPARVTGGEGITLEELGRRVKVSLKGEQGLVDEKVNWVAGSDYEMSIEGSEVGADAHMRLDEDLFFFFFLSILACSLDHGEVPWVPKVPSAQGQGRMTIYKIITHANTKEKVFVHHKQSHTLVTSK